MSGPIEGIDPLIAPLLYCFEQVRQDLAVHTAGLTDEQLWSRPFGLGSAGFHIRHLGASADRLATYLRGEMLSEAQMARLKSESEPGTPLEQLLAQLHADLQAVEAIVKAVDIATLREFRGVGRKRLPTTVHGLLVHIAEHSQRHLGQAITTIKLVRALPREGNSGYLPAVS